MNCSSIKPVFTTNPIDRKDVKRSDYRLSAEADLEQRFLLLHKGQVVSLKGEYFVKADPLPQVVFEQPLWVYLGELENIDYVAVGVNTKLFETLNEQGFEAIPIRQMVLDELLSDDFLSIIAEGNSLLSWHVNHGFCAKCGAKSELAHGGWRRDCPSCGAEHFPRTDPVVIMLVTYSDMEGDKCLLGRGVNFPEGRYSCLAGFMEPGETIAQGARRELFEEAGIVGGQVTFLFDQPWPFVSNLMMGVHVEAKTVELNIDKNELADAMWVDKQEVKRILAGATDGPFEPPQRVAIARNLLEYWCNSWCDGKV